MNLRYTHLHLIFMAESSHVMIRDQPPEEYPFVMVLPMGCVMEVYEVVVKAVVTHTFRVVADNQREASERANLMFSNENLGKVLELKFDVHNDQVPDANRLRSY